MPSRTSRRNQILAGSASARPGGFPGSVRIRLDKVWNGSFLPDREDKERALAQAAGLSEPAVLRRLTALCRRNGAELDGARDEVRAMPAGAGVLLETVSAEIAARAATVAFNAGEDGPDEAAEAAARGKGEALST
ncbi:MAG: hypothetical protein IPK75_19730 [Acidobacteria bacterium]|nr:hypothetical protein [Acidobacteriota bacterium]